MACSLAQCVTYLDASLTITSGINDDGITDVLLYGRGNTIEASILNVVGDLDFSPDLVLSITNLVISFNRYDLDYAVSGIGS